jgi:uncharacterized membrane protein YphA (DoxX/SURF4 family)
MNYIFIATVLIILMFLLAGIKKATSISSTANYLKSKINFNIPFSFYQLAIILVFILQISSSIMLLYSAYTGKYSNYATYSAIGLIGFTILATLIFHYPPVGQDYYSFMSNLSTIGGLLMLVLYFKNKYNSNIINE